MVARPSLLGGLRAALQGEAPRRYWLAYSGGLDSRVLLDLLLSLRAQQADFPALHIVHIHHGLQAEADTWAQQCKALCESLCLPCEIHRVQLNVDGAGIEAAARQARYRVFEQLLDAGEVLLQAHHLDDQCETLMLRLLRGAGPEGLAAMPRRRRLGRGQLLRPLLDVPRGRLLAYAQRRALSWQEDPSNADPRFDRNYLRAEVMPRLGERWPAYRHSLARAAGLQAQAATLLDGYLEQDLRPLVDGCTLDLAGLQAQPEARQLALLHYYLRSYWQLSLERAQLHSFARQFLWSRGDAAPQFCAGGWRFHRYRGQLCAEPVALVAPQREELLNWSLESPLQLPQGCLTARRGGNFVPDGPLSVRFRRGGERCQLAGEGHSRSLKKLLQAWGVPPQRRERLPLLYCGERLAAVADMAICEGFYTPVSEMGWQLSWRDAAEH